jgi:hypothetical protein
MVAALTVQSRQSELFGVARAACFERLAAVLANRGAPRDICYYDMSSGESVSVKLVAKPSSTLIVDICILLYITMLKGIFDRTAEHSNVGFMQYNTD